MGGCTAHRRRPAARRLSVPRGHSNGASNRGSGITERGEADVRIASHSLNYPGPEFVMATITQTGRPLAVNTPLGKDVLLLVNCNGQEAISTLFRFQLDLIAENSREIAFDKVLGQKITV